MGRRMVLLVAALLVASLGTLLIYAYVDAADKRALENQEPVKVLVAKTLIKAGTLGEEASRQGAFKLQDVPRSATIQGVLGDARAITGLVAVSDIFPGEQIITAKFAQAGTTSVLPIPRGDIAMSVQLGDPQRVAGFVQPGSEVAVFVTITPPARAGGGGGGAVAAPDRQTRILLPRVTVLAVGPTTLRAAPEGEGNQEALPTAILTLAADQEEAQKLIYASENGQLYFALLNEESDVSAGTPVDLNTLFS